MQTFSPFITFIAGLLITAVVAWLVCRQRERDFKICIASYSEQIKNLQADNEGLLDRLHATRNLPPMKVDMAAERQERRDKEAVQEAKRGFEGPSRVRGIGSVEEAQMGMLEEVRRRANSRS